MAEQANKSKKKRPTAQKREIQNLKRRMINKSHKSYIRTTIRGLEESLTEKQDENSQSFLNKLFSLYDKGVKKGIIKQNKANRKKAQYSKLIKAS
ncbi:MAG: 30S ribosomal protein S20 [Chlamydiota bacterium]|jgi:small subunit ribosomal protein S20